MLFKNEEDSASNQFVICITIFWV